MSTAITEPPRELVTELDAIRRMADAIIIDDSASYEAAALRLREVKTYTDRVTEFWKPLVDAAHRAHKALTGRRAEMIDPATLAEITIKGKITKWFTEEQRRKQDEARREQERIRKEEEDRRLAEAAQMEKEGHAAEAEKHIEAPIAVPAVVAAPPAPKITGVSMREEWNFEIVDRAAIPREFWLLDETAIRRTVRAMKDRTNIPGIKATMKMVPAASGY